MSLNVQNFSKRNHRTALFVDAAKRANDKEYRERSDRLIQSLNGDNIKTDIFEVDGLTVRPLGSTAKESNSAATEDDLRSWAAKTGYTQVLVSMPAKA
jgi:hypothetical protein